MQNNRNKNITLIKKSKGLSLGKIIHIYQYKDLLYYFVKKEVVVLYKQTILGFSWAILRPLFTMLIFTFIFGNLAKMPSDGVPYPIFSYVALVPWTYFSTSMVRSTESLISNAGIFTKVYFPRIIIPITPVISGLIDFSIALTIVFLMMIWYKIQITFNILFILPLIFIMIMTSSGIGFWLSSLSIQYRDVRHAIPFIAQFLLYAAPVAWPTAILKSKYGDLALYLYGLYPMVGVIEGFRSAFLNSNEMPLLLIAISSLSSLIIFISGMAYFSYKEKIFADVS